ncbi:MAG: PAS domain S-box protein [Pseudomonadota bacterium]
MPEKTLSRLIDALDALEDGIYIVNESSVIEYMNGPMVKIFGQGVGRKCHEVINKSCDLCPWCQRKDLLDIPHTQSREVLITAIGKTFSVVDFPVTNKDGSRSKLSIYRDITQRKEQEARLRSSEEDYRRLFNHVGCGVFVSSKKGRFLDVNPALLKMLGYTDKQEFLSLDLATEVYLKPEDRSVYQAIVEDKGSVVDYEVDWKRKDGSIVPVLLTSNVRYDSEGNILGYEGIIVDQSQRKKSENRLKEAHDFLDKTISCCPDAIMATDMTGNVIIWNQAAEDTFGYTGDEVIGKKSITEIYTEGVAQKVMRMMRSGEYGGRGKLKSYPLTFHRKNGDVVEGNLSASILYDEAGTEIASVGIFVDLEERLKMERKLSETQQHLLQSEKLAAMGRLTSQIAHELNNPLFGIMNTLELMKTEISPQNKRRRLLDMSLSETMRLADMLKKMLSFSKPDQEEKLDMNINTVLEEILLLYDKRLRENSIKIQTDFVDNPAIIRASKDQLRQVFLNMFSNAMDAMPDGGTLSITTAMEGNKMIITLADTGIGIKEEHQEKIFDSFFTTKTDSVKGVGLGLSVCYGFIKEHGGDIKVESKPGHGAKFRISLPVSRNPASV